MKNFRNFAITIACMFADIFILYIVFEWYYMIEKFLNVAIKRQFAVKSRLLYINIRVGEIYILTNLADGICGSK